MQKRRAEPQAKALRGLLQMGRVAGTYGVRGWVKVAPDGGGAEALVASGEWWLGATAYRVEQAKLHSATVLAKLAGLESREQAQKLRGETVFVRRETLPDPGPGRYYLADLVGLEVVNEQGEALGTVRRLFTNGAQDVMELDGRGKTRLLPWVPTVVKAVDLAERRIVVEWGADW